MRAHVDAGRPAGIPLCTRVRSAENPGMSGPTTPVTRGQPWWWVLLLLPLALATGWGVGQLPTPEQAVTVLASPAAEPTAATVASGREPTPAGDASHEVPAARTQISGAARTELAPQRETGRPSEPPVRNEFSQWTTLELAILESRRNGKPVMIDFNADWCSPCRRMKREVFEDDAHASTVQTAVIPVSIVDRAREDGRNPSEIEDLLRRYEVEAFPTLIVFSPGTGRVARTKGYGNADATVSWITAAARSVR